MAVEKGGEVIVLTSDECSPPGLGNLKIPYTLQGASLLGHYGWVTYPSAPSHQCSSIVVVVLSPEAPLICTNAAAFTVTVILHQRGRYQIVHYTQQRAKVA